MSQSDQPERQKDTWFDRIKTVLGVAEPGSVREDIEDALHTPAVADDFSPKERQILFNVLGMREVRVSDVMTPRARMIGVNETASLAEVFAVFRAESHARLPVYGETADDPKGMIHIRDFLAWIGGEGDAPLRGAEEKLATLLKDAPLLRPVLFVPPSMPALDLMVKMQSKRLHMALVINEYGETDGVATMEDLVEAIVGDIDDEHDTPEPTKLERLDNRRIAASASATLDDVSDMLGLTLESDVAGVEVDSIGGLVTALAGRVPHAGETLEGPEGLVFEIAEADLRRIRRLIIVSPADLNPARVDGGDSPAGPAADDRT